MKTHHDRKKKTIETIRPREEGPRVEGKRKEGEERREVGAGAWAGAGAAEVGLLRSAKSLSNIALIIHPPGDGLRWCWLNLHQRQ